MRNRRLRFVDGIGEGAMLTDSQKAAVAVAEAEIFAIISTLEREQKLSVEDIQAYAIGVEISAWPAE
jgi:hypothetical protein